MPLFNKPKTPETESEEEIKQPTPQEKEEVLFGALEAIIRRLDSIEKKLDELK